MSSAVMKVGTLAERYFFWTKMHLRFIQQCVPVWYHQQHETNKNRAKCSEGRHKSALTSEWHHDVTLHLGCTNCTTKTRVCKICPRACERHYQALLSTPALDPCIAAAAAAFSIWTFSWERRGGGGLSHTFTLWHHNITLAFMHDVPETGLVRAERLGFAKVQQGGQT